MDERYIAPIVKSDRFKYPIINLMYSQVCTRTNVTFIVRMLGRYQSKSDLKHWRATKEVRRYLKRIKDFMLGSRENDNLDVGYSKL